MPATKRPEAAAQPMAWGRLPGHACEEPGCDGHYVLRQNRHNQALFLGCSRYPDCKGTAPLRGAHAAAADDHTDDVETLRARVQELRQRCDRMTELAHRRGLSLVLLRRHLARDT